MCVLFSFDFPCDSACSRRETDLREREGEEMGVGGVIAGKSVLGEGWGGLQVVCAPKSDRRWFGRCEAPLNPVLIAVSLNQLQDQPPWVDVIVAPSGVLAMDRTLDSQSHW